MSEEKEKSENLGSFSEMNGMVLDQDKEFYDMLNIHIKSISEKEPVEINFEEELMLFLSAGLLRPFESEAMKTKYLHVIIQPRIIKMVKLCFWSIMASRFPETIETAVQTEISEFYQKKIASQYVKLFQALPQPKSEVMTLIIFTIAYLIHFAFYKYFPPQRQYLDIRFILNCYHTVLFEFNGLFVSDYYIKTMIEKIFTHHFLDYEKKNIKELLLRQIELKKLNNKKFLGFELKFPDISAISNDQYEVHNASEFKDRIMTLLKRDKKLPTNLEKNTPKQAKPQGESLRKQVPSDTLESSTKKIEKDSQNSGNLKLNCNQVSPTIGKLLEYENQNLPFSKKKMIKHQFERIEEHPSQLLSQMRAMFSEHSDQGNKRKEIRLPTKGKSLIDQYGLHAPPKEYYETHANTGPLFKNMLDVNYILTEESGLRNQQLPGNSDITNIFQNKNHSNNNKNGSSNFNKQVSQIALQNDQKTLQDKINDQMKQIQLIQSLQEESGNKDIFDMPYTGTRSEGRKLLGYVRDKSRKGLEALEKKKQSQSVQESSLESQLKRAKSEAPKQTSSVQHQQQQQQSFSPATSQLILPPIQTGRNPDFISPGPPTNIQNLETTAKKDRLSQVQFSFLSGISQQLQKNNSIFLSPKQDQQFITQKADESARLPAIQSSLSVDNLMINQRKIISRVMQKEEVTKPSHHGNLPEYILNRALDPGMLYDDKRKDYREKYSAIFNKISVDQNINDLCLNIIKKRNLLSHGVKKNKMH